MGHEAVPVFLLDGPSPVLFDAGFTALGPHYEREIKKLIGSRAPTYLFITHSHWDHIGAAGHFKTIWPDLRIAGSSRMQETLNRPGALRSIAELNRQGAREMRYWENAVAADIPFKSFSLDVALDPGDSLELAPDCHVKALYTPGHTWDHMSYWIPEKGILVASEAVGCEHMGRITAEFLVDYDVYRKSLVSLNKLEPQILCLAHQFVFTGADVRDYLRRSLEAGDAFVKMVEKFLQEAAGDIELVVHRVRDMEWKELPFPKQPEPAFLLSTRARVRHVWERMKRRERGR